MAAPTRCIWSKIAAVSGAASVGLAAYGAHGLKPSAPNFQTSYDNANRLHMVHSAVLLGVSACGRTAAIGRPAVAGALLTAGILGFSGSLYAVSSEGVHFETMTSPTTPGSQYQAKTTYFTRLSFTNTTPIPRQYHANNVHPRLKCVSC
jgi:uncharacterized membrane protein YgdD (TMEM256/DUF423 family)